MGAGKKRMTKELMDGCSQALEDAIDSGDQTQVWRAIARTNRALMECQLKTSQRVKNLVKCFWGCAAVFCVAFLGNSELAVRLISAFFKV